MYNKYIIYKHKNNLKSNYEKQIPCTLHPDWEVEYYKTLEGPWWGCQHCGTNWALHKGFCQGGVDFLLEDGGLSLGYKGSWLLLGCWPTENDPFSLSQRGYLQPSAALFLGGIPPMCSVPSTRRNNYTEFWINCSLIFLYHFTICVCIPKLSTSLLFLLKMPFAIVFISEYCSNKLPRT